MRYYVSVLIKEINHARLEKNQRKNKKRDYRNST
jgi:hypothetical protein